MEIIKKFEPLFGEWYAESFLGAGNYGRVYKAYKEELGSRYYSAIKYISIPSSDMEVASLMDDSMSGDSITSYYDALAKDVASETRLMSRLKGYSNIVSYEDSRVVKKPNGVGYDIFIRMELLQSLSQKARKAPLTVSDVVDLGTDICTALDVCSEHGIIHRDIKPDNIFQNAHGDYKLGDFGIARQLEKTETFMSKKGTYNYMAPEVYKGEKYGSSCDICSLGLVMYRLLNKNRLPFLPPAPRDITPTDKETALMRRLSGEALPMPCDADSELGAIVLKACAYRPEDRYASAAEMRDALRKYKAGMPAAAKAAGAGKSAAAGAAAAGAAAAKAQGSAEKTVGVSGDPEATRAAMDNVKPVGPAARDVPPRSAKAAPQKVFCTKCGTPLPQGSVFCPNCGTKMAAPAVSPAQQRPAQQVQKPAQQVQKPVQQTQRPVQQQQRPVQQQQPPVQPVTPQEPKKKSKAGLITGIAAALVLIIGGLAAAGYFLLRGDNDDDDTPRKTPKTVADITPEPTQAEVVVTEAPAATETHAAETDSATPTPYAAVTPTPYAVVTPTPYAYTTQTAGAVTPAPGNAPDPNAAVYFTTSALESALRSKAGLSGTITYGDLARLTTLDLSNCGLTDITELQYCTNLTSLKLNGSESGGSSTNKIRDLSPLSGLTKLTFLEVKYNDVYSLEPLRSLTNLVTLSVPGNHISDLDPMRGMTKLDHVGLGSNEIRDMSPIQYLPITYLAIKGNYINDFSPLLNMTRLTYLSIYNQGGSNNVLSDISYLYNLKNLNELRYSGSQISESQLATLKSVLPNVTVWDKINNA